MPVAPASSVKLDGVAGDSEVNRIVVGDGGGQVVTGTAGDGGRAVGDGGVGQLDIDGLGAVGPRASSKAVKVKLKLPAMKLLSKLKVLPARLTPVAAAMAVSMSPSKVLVKSASVAVPILAMSTLTMLVPVGPRPG